MTECPAHTPDFFIIGAPKCGTTALYDYLKSHPDVSLPAVKEPTYFAEEFRSQRGYIRTPEDYADLYKSAGRSQLTGDASPYYLYSKTAISSILQCNPNAKFIAIIRNPLDMLPSYHAQALRVMIQPEKDLETAWHNQSEDQPPNLYYRDVCSLGTQLERLIESVPEDQRHIMLYDDFKRDTRAAYLDLLNFLQLPDDGRTDFARSNQRTQLRSPALQKLVRASYYILKPLKPIVNALGLRPLSALNKANQTKIIEKQKMSAEFKQHLLQEFEPEIQMIEKRLNRNLSHWRM